MTENKALPFSLQVECDLVGTLLVNEDAINEVIDILEIEDFYNSANQIIYKALTKLYMRDIKADMVTISNEIGEETLTKIGGVTYLSKLIDSGTSGVNIINYAEIIKEKSNRRKLIKAAQNLIDKAYDEKVEIQDIVNKTQDKLLETTNTNDKLIYTDDELMTYTLQAIQERYKSGGEIPGMRTGSKLLDNAINGFKRGELNIIAGRPSMGKTVFALNVADGLAAEGYKVALFEMEMTPEALGMRRLAAKAYIDSIKLNRGSLNDDEWERLGYRTGEIAGRNNMFTDCSVNLSIQDIKARSKKIKQKYGLDVIIVDHLTLMKMAKKERRDLEVADTTMHLKFLAKELDVTVILLSQLSRAVEQRSDKRPMLSDLRESGAIEQDADTIMFLYRDEYYDVESEEKGILEVNIAKQRNGKTGALKFIYKEEYQLITEMFKR
ncbi:replicative DNA helicase [Clostridium sporogenes]|uniref:replicative DNA helicase n=1 Tax=Clostridium sporogenes TaxID=1509 RepID=UPI002237A9E9|nr:replicative DNA helicase [Clostridium sporogenes]MCW6075511.1 replicative DNA helicase [Clostridium sporogenes]